MRRPGIVAGFLATLVVAGMVAGCDIGASASPTPRPTPRGTATVTPTETPPPTPSDLAKAFVATMAKPTFEFEATLSGKMVMTATGTQLTVDFAGSMKYKAGDYANTSRTTSLGKTTTSDEVVLGKYKYTRQGTGKWKREAAPSAKVRLGFLNLVAGNPELTEVGIETKGGKPLHKLTFAAGPTFDMASVGDSLNTSTFADVEAKAYFWAAGDGTPAGVSIDLTGRTTVSGVTYDVTFDTDYMFTKLSGVKITAPKM